MLGLACSTHFNCSITQSSVLGSFPRYMICVTLFCMLRESKNTRTSENFTQKRNACNSRLSVCFLTCAKYKNLRQNLIPRATAYSVSWSARQIIVSSASQQLQTTVRGIRRHFSWVNIRKTFPSEGYNKSNFDGQFESCDLSLDVKFWWSDGRVYILRFESCAQTLDVWFLSSYRPLAACSEPHCG